MEGLGGGLLQADVALDLQEKGVDGHGPRRRHVDSGDVDARGGGRVLALDEEALRLGYISEAEFDEIVRPETMIGPRKS